MMTDGEGVGERGTIPFTQFLLPDGRKAPLTVDCSVEVASVAESVIADGYEFQIEILTTREVSMTCFDPQEEEDIAIEVCPNGPGIEEAVGRLVKQARLEARPRKEAT